MRIKVLAQNDGLADQCQEYTHTFKITTWIHFTECIPKTWNCRSAGKKTTCDLLYAQRETGKLKSKLGKEK